MSLFSLYLDDIELRSIMSRELHAQRGFRILDPPLSGLLLVQTKAGQLQGSVGLSKVQYAHSTPVAAT